MHYAPYGELIDNQVLYGYDERYKFTGKEKEHGEFIRTVNCRLPSKDIEHLQKRQLNVKCSLKIY